MKVLVACEYSGTVRDAFIKKGHNAISCDLLDTDAERITGVDYLGGHYKGNVEDVRTRLEKIYSAPVGITTTV